MTTMTDHPRSRGVYTPIGGTIGENFGSSPLARGLRCGAPYPRALPGIIPARAGFTDHLHHCPCDRLDHPRSRGGYPRGNRMDRSGRGSSPLARGLLPRPP